MRDKRKGEIDALNETSPVWYNDNNLSLIGNRVNRGHQLRSTAALVVRGNEPSSSELSICI